MYSWILIFIEGKVIDLVVEGANAHKTLMIISNETSKIKEFILNDINRGATIINAEGGYSGEEKQILYTILSRREATILRYRINEIDPQAFINIIDSKEIIGKGFNAIEQ
jgi:uncharacterized membrane-anchored protein YitT (DUF2179 family)